MPRRAVPPLAILLAVAALAGCSRDLAVPPKPSIAALGIVPAFQSAAPRQPLQFAGTGGVAPYSFAFAQGGRLSGADASLSASGAYVAGSSGSAQDVVEVTDSRGVTAIATVSVGQRIAITPAFTGTVPGGRIAFQATGGSGTYLFTSGTNGSGGSTSAIGVYLAGPAGNTVDTVFVTDDTPWAAQYPASAKAEIQVSAQLQLYRSETRAVAPNESVTFIALGGQPPYTFSMATKGSGPDARIDANSGVYVAGTRSGDPDPYAVTTDVIQVTDHANVPQTATLAVPVGARLRLVIGVAEVHPGEVVQLTALGGKPPYTFGFAERTSPATEPLRDRGGNGGNRSGGAVTAVAGLYVPGASPGAIDFLQVTDATGAPPDVRQGPPVTGVTFAVERGVGQCLAADVNGDLSQDAVLVARNEKGTRMVTASYLATPSPLVRTFYLDQRDTPALFAHQLQRRNRDALLGFGGQPVCEVQTGCQQVDRDVWGLEPDLAGNLAFRQLAGGVWGQPLTVANDPPFTGYTHTETQSFQLAVGSLVVDPAGVATAWLYADGYDADTIPSATNFPPYACPAVTSADRTILRWSWVPGASGPSRRPECLLVKGGGCPACDPYSTRMVALETGDFDGDGKTDLAYVQTDGRVDYADGTMNARVYVALGRGGTLPGVPASFDATGHQAWPLDAASGSWRFEYRDRHSQVRFMTVAAPSPRAPGAKDTLVVRLIDPAGNPRLFATHDPALGFSAAFDPSAAGRGSAGVSRYQVGGVTSTVSWDGGGGEVRVFDVTGVTSAVPGLAPRNTASTMTFGVSAACFPDANGDGIPDLVAASDLAQTAQLVLGDGADSTDPAAGQTFGLRAHLRGSEFPVAVGDLDGDGFADVVAAASGAGLDVLWGGGGMLARGARLSTAAVYAVAVGDFGRGPAAPSVFFQDRTGAFGIVHGDGHGRFEPALAVPGVTADGGAVGPIFMLVTPADLGTSAPGLDLVTMETSATGAFAHGVLNQGARMVDVKSRAIPQGDSVHRVADGCWTLPVGVGRRAVASLCVFDDTSSSNNDRNLAVLNVSQLQNPDGSPGTGGQPAFSDWVTITDTTASPWKNPTPGVRGDVAQAGRLPDGTAVFFVGLGSLYAVEVRLVGTDPLQRASWDVRTYAVAGAPPKVMIGAIGKLDGDPAAFHVVATTEAGLAVIRRDASGYTLTQLLSVMLIPMGIGPLAAGSPGDVVGVIGNFAGGGFSGVTELVPVLNRQDGTGRLR
jgi:hypothetical protein